MWGILTFILLLPLAAMQFTDQVNWTGFDFFIAASLLFGMAMAIEIAICLIPQKISRYIIVAIIILTALSFWIDGAVGIF
ncbi:hypothetical protein LPB140_01390 [Sphingorhabdus lutea]|uniref:Uncharacterized protein n=2 Tax=Sphingorhabdus lutea TaxID=1913578 RepID=A0A1L3J990_9SPHN|nr:hypothetical protein LPB140_01390 [Sphingorhabdus lutea]